jgi:hypothetical protein
VTAKKVKDEIKISDNNAMIPVLSGEIRALFFSKDFIQYMVLLPHRKW